MNRRYYILAPSALFLMLVYFFLDFAGGMKEFSPFEPGRVPANSGAVVVLTGGIMRSDAGIALLREGKAGVLILSGVSRDADLDSIFIHGLAPSERKTIILDKRSTNTYENAVEVKRLMGTMGLNEMVLITSVYHMKRALMVFKRVMPPDTVIEPYPVESRNFTARRWWEGRGVIITAGEFVKYYAYWFKFRLEDF